MVRFHRRFPAGIAMVVLLTGAWGCESEPPAPPAASKAPEAQQTPPTTTSVAQPRPTEAIPFSAPPAAYTGELPPLPVSFYAPARPMEVLRAVYTFAARHPEVLHYVPCFCGCQNSGHKDNDDCFIQSRDASGRPTWEPHGMTWTVCIDVARDAMQMHNSGASVSQIRSTIEQRYRPHFDTMTPTSPPPKGK